MRADACAAIAQSNLIVVRTFEEERLACRTVICDGNQAAPRASYMFSMLTDTEHFAKESCYQPLMSFLGFSSFL